MIENYFNRNEISNSDLAEIKKYFYGSGFEPDSTNAFRFGNLFDAIVTEPAKVDFLNCRVEDIQYAKDEFETAMKMRDSLLNDDLFNLLKSQCNFQVVKTKTFQFDEFTINARCKYDFLMKEFKENFWGGDLKSTSAKTYSEFLKSIDIFSYYRQRAWYMDIIEAKRDLLIAVSKYNFKVFKVFINHESEIYKKGKAEYIDLCNKLRELTLIQS